MTALAPTFQRGDRVSHAARPEWGTGVVDRADPAEFQGKPAQKLVVTFAQRGRVTLTTAVAPLVLASTAARNLAGASATSPRNSPQISSRIPPRSTPRDFAADPSPPGLFDAPAQDPIMTPARSPSASSSRSGEPRGWLAQLEQKAGSTPGFNNHHELWALPHNLSDPFLSDQDRLQHTLDTFRYSTEPRRLIDWAVVQTGLPDPLTKYTRHELEQGFARYARDRDLHLREMVRLLKRSGKHGMLEYFTRNAPTPTAREALQRAIRA